MDETYPMESTDVETIFTEPSALADEGTDPTIPDESVPETTYETVPETTAALIEPTESEPEEYPDTGDTSILETIYEQLYGSPYEDPTEATEAPEEVVLVDVIERIGSDIVHAVLFSGFLVCGTLVGIALLRKIYGT